jgi:hypothetical protein
MTDYLTSTLQKVPGAPRIELRVRIRSIKQVPVLTTFPIYIAELHFLTFII